ncbi:uncharacterized protein [Musca autumnalis]|uniref:uncharacterized protein n=1 Tax=Musca autumnalis TaxID=221902 RepID=UPI003CF3C8CA
MSYLLTEIALEMLGYKFYDIYGVQEDINNFQNLAATDRSSECSTSNEPHLSTVLGLDNTSKRTHNINPSANTTTNDGIKVKLPDLVVKLTDVEYNKVKEQVIRNKPLQHGENQSEIAGAKSSQQAIPHLVELEHQKLLKEQQNLKQFRKYVEQNLMHFNPTCFERYVEMFKGT